MKPTDQSKTTCIGLWIDHREAKLVRFEGDEPPVVSTMESEVEPRSKSQGGAAPNPQQHRVGGASHKKADHRRVNQSQRFMNDVAAAVHVADEIAIIGPGFAKQELEKALQESQRDGWKILAVEPAERMTEPQLIARFKTTFGL